MSTLEQKISTYKRQQSRVRAEEDAAAAADDKMSAKQRAALQLREIRQRISEGESTGDHLMDINIMVRGSILKDVGYEFLKWLDWHIGNSAGELMVCHGHRPEIILLPADPTICWTRSRATHLYGHYQVGVLGELHAPQISFSYRDWEVDNEGITIDVYTMENFQEQPLWGNQPTGVARLFISTYATQKWFEQQSTYDAFRIWEMMKFVGSPLEMFPRLAADIQVKREDRVVEVALAVRRWHEQQDRIKRYQRHPALALQELKNCRYTPIHDGVQIHFGINSEVQTTHGDLVDLVVNSVKQLDMADNKHVQEAAVICDLDLKGM